MAKRRFAVLEVVGIAAYGCVVLVVVKEFGMVVVIGVWAGCSDEEAAACSEESHEELDSVDGGTRAGGFVLLSGGG
jgi:hypothetical protein